MPAPVAVSTVQSWFEPSTAHSVPLLSKARSMRPKTTLVTTVIQTNSTTRSGTSPRSSRRWTERQWRRCPKAASVALKIPLANARRSPPPRSAFSRFWGETCASSLPRSHEPFCAASAIPAATSTRKPTRSVRKSVPSELVYATAGRSPDGFGAPLSAEPGIVSFCVAEPRPGTDARSSILSPGLAVVRYERRHVRLSSLAIDA